jgi:hypothetical protein
MRGSINLSRSNEWTDSKGFDESHVKRSSRPFSVSEKVAQTERIHDTPNFEQSSYYSGTELWTFSVNFDESKAISSSESLQPSEIFSVTENFADSSHFEHSDSFPETRRLQASPGFNGSLAFDSVSAHLLPSDAFWRRILSVTVFLSILRISLRRV